MNIIEATKRAMETGCWIRRNGSRNRCEFKPAECKFDGFLIRESNESNRGHGIRWNPDYEDILADDYELVTQDMEDEIEETVGDASRELFEILVTKNITFDDAEAIIRRCQSILFSSYIMGRGRHDVRLAYAIGMENTSPKIR